MIVWSLRNMLCFAHEVIDNFRSETVVVVRRQGRFVLAESWWIALIDETGKLKLRHSVVENIHWVKIDEVSEQLGIVKGFEMKQRYNEKWFGVVEPPACAS